MDLGWPWLVSVHLVCPSWAPVLHSISEDPLLHLCLPFTTLPALSLTQDGKHPKAPLSLFLFSSPSLSLRRWYLDCKRLSKIDTLNYSCSTWENTRSLCAADDRWVESRGDDKEKTDFNRVRLPILFFQEVLQFHSKNNPSWPLQSVYEKQPLLHLQMTAGSWETSCSPLWFTHYNHTVRLAYHV